MQHSIVIPSDSHSGINYPPFANADGFETTDCLECLQILNILIYGRRAWQQCLVATGYKSSIQEIHWISIKMVSRSVLKPDKGKNADFWLNQTWRLDIVHYIRIWSSRTGNVMHASHLQIFCLLAFLKENIPLPPLTPYLHLQPVFSAQTAKFAAFSFLRKICCIFSFAEFLHFSNI